ncbi:AAEL012348-PA [Aedes aegypti]|uniref:AAEL012348-PA n=2 Tax=Aedes aegypti TaxID=7159 RepID=Q16EE4_AEDAE|nr:splicing factor 3A subunit 3 [Aedes aegypti]XP_001662502.1 splicing factor 3A subunit 3 [Aedes aegypti]EAT32600.1 AAEL015244-PA [Aedes aegypti]EAT35494.1 AAEL012348-PA [Aedes aegypti]
METIFEIQRRLHEECDRLVMAMSEELQTPKKTTKDKVLADHRIKIYLERYQSCSKSLLELYQDKDGERKQEITNMSVNEFKEFYSQFNSLVEFHQNHGNNVAIPASIEFSKLREQLNDPAYLAEVVKFSDVENYGQYLDLHECFDNYVNLKGVDKIDYITYLSEFNRFADVPRKQKNVKYKKYLELLHDYLQGFITRSRPLFFELEHTVKRNELQFEDLWKNGEAPGWERGKDVEEDAMINLNEFGKWEDLTYLGLDRLKSALQAIGMKCGGTLEERAQRLFACKEDKNKENEHKRLMYNQKDKDIALLEYKITKLAELVDDQIYETKINLQRKQARYTLDESDEDSMDEVESDDDDGIPYNPKNLPLGYDGKPIPYWLYKLHQLHFTYECEICGNYKYNGPKAFQNHFSEWRHAHGMRCLGIPNTAHFANITKIEDALMLWDKVKEQTFSKMWVPANEEEFEDSRGNILSKKVYLDLQKQGLL